MNLNKEIHQAQKDVPHPRSGDAWPRHKARARMQRRRRNRKTRQ